MSDPAPPAASWLGRRDDRARLVALVLLAFAVASLEHQPPVLAALGLGLALLVSLRLPRGRLWSRLAPLVALLVPLALLTPLWHPPGAEPLVAGWRWGPTDRGLALTGLILSRVLALALLAFGALEAAPFARSLAALQRLRLPQALTHTLLLSYRYLTLLREELGRTRHALRARAFRAGPNPRTLRVYAGVSGGLLLRGLARTERCEQAMTCRGYRGRLALGPAPAAGLADLALVLVALGAGAALVVWDRGGWVG
ncbi:MAG: energy-coupling factor transporter transmembrane component T [Planctomycetota bacterium]